MIPTRRLALLVLAPLAFGIAAIADPGLWWAMIAGDLAIVLFAGADAWLARRPLVVIERQPPEVFSVGRTHPVELELRSECPRPLEIRVTDALFDGATAADLPCEVRLGPRGRASPVYHVTPNRRGAYALGEHTVRYPSPLGLWSRQVTLPARDEVHVYPDIRAVRAFELMARQDRALAWMRASRRRGNENEFECLREYQRDDDYRAIDWRATARRGKLIARQYQREQNQSLLFALDSGRLMTAETAGLSLFDHALNAALMLAHVAVRGGDHVGVMCFSDDVHAYAAPASGRRATHRLVAACFDQHPGLVETDFEQTFARLGRRLRKRSLVAVFTQIVDEVSADALLASVQSMHPRHLPLCVLFRDAELDALAMGGGERGDVGLYVSAAAAEHLSTRERLVRRLESAGAFVIHVEPATLTPALINRYLEIKARHLL